MVAKAEKGSVGVGQNYREQHFDLQLIDKVGRGVRKKGRREKFKKTVRRSGRKRDR